MTPTLLHLLAQSDARLDRVCGAETSLACRKTFEWTNDADTAQIVSFALDKPLAILLIVLGAAVLSRLARRGLKRGLRRLNAGAVKERMGSLRSRTPSALLETGELGVRSGQRVEAVGAVLGSILGFAIWTIAAFLVLGQLGVNLGPLLAGAGIIGIALGFGSQSLVKDFLAGVFILVEDQFGVGDVVDLGEATGVVEAVSLRTTRLRGIDGTVWHIPNGEIQRVGNQSQHWSRVLLDIEVAYGTDIPTARAAIKREADRVWGEDDRVLEEPEIWGVENLGANGVAIRLVVKTKPSEQFPIGRTLRERIKAAFDHEGIEIPFPQQTVWMRTEGPDGAAAAARYAGTSREAGGEA